MNLTEFLTMSSDRFKQEFFSPENREKNYDEFTELMSNLGKRGREETAFSKTVGGLSPDEFVDLSLFFFGKSVKERNSTPIEKDDSYYCFWRNIEREYIIHRGMLFLAQEVFPIYFKRLSEMEDKDLYWVFRVSDEDSTNMAVSTSMFVDMFRVQLQLCNPERTKCIQKASVEEILTHLNFVSHGKIPEDVVTKLKVDLQKKVDDPEFNGMIYMNVQELNRSMKLSNMLGSMLGQISDISDRSLELDSLFDSINPKKKEGGDGGGSVH